MLSSSIIALTRACRQVVYFDLIKRLPRDPKNQLDFHSQDFDLMLSVISTQARTGARRRARCYSGRDARAGLLGGLQSGPPACGPRHSDHRAARPHIDAAHHTTLFGCQSSVRYGCAGGNHRARILGELVEDWVNRSLCATYHLPLSAANVGADAIAWLERGVQWLDCAGQPGQSSRHALSVCVCVFVCVC